MLLRDRALAFIQLTSLTAIVLFFSVTLVNSEVLAEKKSFSCENADTFIAKKKKKILKLKQKKKKASREKKKRISKKIKRLKKAVILAASFKANCSQTPSGPTPPQAPPTQSNLERFKLNHTPFDPAKFGHIEVGRTMNGSDFYAYFTSWADPNGDGAASYGEGEGLTSYENVYVGFAINGEECVIKIGTFKSFDIGSYSCYEGSRTMYGTCKIREHYLMDFTVSNSSVINDLHERFPNDYPYLTPAQPGAKDTLLIGIAADGTLTLAPGAPGMAAQWDNPCGSS